jgi:flagellar biosynthesis protein FlhB
MHAETLALLTKPLYFPNMKYLEQLSWFFRPFFMRKLFKFTKSIIKSRNVCYFAVVMQSL